MLSLFHMIDMNEYSRITAAITVGPAAARMNGVGYNLFPL